MRFQNRNYLSYQISSRMDVFGNALNCISYCGLNENGSHSLMYLNAWFPAVETVWEVLGGLALLSEVCYWDWIFRLPKTLVIPSAFFSA